MTHVAGNPRSVSSVYGWESRPLWHIHTPRALTDFDRLGHALQPASHNSTTLGKSVLALEGPWHLFGCYVTIMTLVSFLYPPSEMREEVALWGRARLSCLSDIQHTMLIVCTHWQQPIQASGYLLKRCHN